MSQSDNIEINSSNAPNLSLNVEDSNDNGLRKFHCQLLKIRRERKSITLEIYKSNYYWRTKGKVHTL